MKTSLEWLQQYTEVAGRASDVARSLTSIGIEVERIERVGRDTVFEMEITPNRPDCLNIVGLARELAAATGARFSGPKIGPRSSIRERFPVAIEAETACERYIATEIRGVRVAAAPKEIMRRLASVGSRPISNIVDITNYCLFELGQPLHAFDRDTLRGGRIIVRFAREGERIVTIDGKERVLNPSILVIADAERPVAIAGIMGGADTQVTDKTTNILLESAWFDPVTVRRASRALGLASDASYHFERGVAYDTVLTGSVRATEMIMAHAGGEVSAYHDLKIRRAVRRRGGTIVIDRARMNRFLGTVVGTAEIGRLFKALGFDARTTKTGWSLVPPAERGDLHRPEDIYEEVARMIGYDAIPSSLPLVAVTGMPVNPRRQMRRRIAASLVAQGCDETITYAMVSREVLERCLMAAESSVAVVNPLSAEQERMRPSLLPSMIKTAQFNANHGRRDIKIFETGKAYLASGEHERVAVLMAGERGDDWRSRREARIDFYDLKGVVERALEGLRVDRARFVAADTRPFYAAGQQAEIFIGDRLIGHLGRLSPAVVAAWGLKDPDVFFAELDLEALFTVGQGEARYNPVCEFPAISRDASLALDQTVTFTELEAIARRIAGTMLRDLHFVELYEGDKLPAGKKGYVLSFVYQLADRTLRDEEVQAVHQKICAAYQSAVGAMIR